MKGSFIIICGLLILSIVTITTQAEPNSLSSANWRKPTSGSNSSDSKDPNADERAPYFLKPLSLRNRNSEEDVDVESEINCYKCANWSSLSDTDWRIFNVTVDHFSYKPCPPKFDPNILEPTKCNFCASIVDKTTQKRKIIYRGCSDKKIRFEEKRKINGERRFHIFYTCQRSFCNAAVGSYPQANDSFLVRLWHWFRLFNPRLNPSKQLSSSWMSYPFFSWLTRLPLINDQLLILGCLQIGYKWFYVSDLLNTVIQR